MKSINKVVVVLTSVGLFWCQEVLALKNCLQELDIIGQTNIFRFPNAFPIVDDKIADPNTYAQTRGLLDVDPLKSQSYSGFLYQGFLNSLLNMKRHGIWVDSGPGAMNSILDYVKLKADEAARIVTISPSLSKVTAHFEALKKLLSPERFFPIVGLKTEQVNEIPEGSIDLFSDVFAAGSYSDRPDLVLLNAIKWLKVDHEAYITLTTDTYLSEETTEATSVFPFFSKKKVKKRWRDRSFLEFFKNIRGVDLMYSIKELGQGESALQLKFIKRDRHFSVPELRLLEMDNSYPPLRRFEKTGNVLVISK